MDYKYRVIETVDQMGRYIYPHEFKWLMDYFTDRYDPRRLCLALMMTTGLRTSNGVHIKLQDFTEGFKEIRVPECKAHTTKEGNKVNMDIKWRWMPLPRWLYLDIKNYVDYRLSIGFYATVDRNLRLFPTLSRSMLIQLLYKLRKRLGDKQTWLKDIWRIYRYFDGDRKLIRERIYYRISCHGTKAFFCTAAYNITEKDIIATQAITMHSELKNLQKYVKTFNVKEDREKMKDMVFEPIISTSEIPLPKDQKKLLNYFQ